MATEERSEDGGSGTTRARWEPSLLVVGLVLALVTFAAYWPVVGYESINLDDPDYILKNEVVQQGLTADSVAWAFTTQHAGNWHPLTWLSHMLDIEMFDLELGGHHIVNLLLHIASALLLMAVIGRTTGNLWAGAFVAGLFALHPLHVESVAWLSERKDTLSTFFWMLTLWAYVQYVFRPGRGRYLGVVLVYALGLLAKPMLVTLPFALLLLDYWPLGRIRAGQTLPTVSAERPASPGIRFLLIEKLPLFALAAVSSVMTLRAQGTGGAIVSAETFSPLARVANSLVSYFGYLGKTIWPRGLSVFYPVTSIRVWQVVASVVLLVGITLLVLRARKRRPYLAVGWFWYLGTLVPVIGWVQVGHQAMADRYTYVPTIGLFLMLALGLPALLAEMRNRTAVLSVAGGVILLVLAVLTRVQVGYWKDSVTLFERALALNDDSALLHNYMASAYVDAGDLNGARRHYETSIFLDPRNVDVHRYAGMVEVYSGNAEAAIERFRAALALDPDHVGALDNLGNTLAQNGRPVEAIPHLQRALELDPDMATTHNSLGNALADMGHAEEAFQHYETAVRLDPNYVNAHANLADMLARSGRLDEAVPHFETIVALEPDNARARMKLGRLLALKSDFDAAQRHLEAAVRIEPGYPDAYYYLGLVYLSTDNPQKASEQHQILTSLSPDLAARLLRAIQGGP